MTASHPRGLWPHLPLLVVLAAAACNHPLKPGASGGAGAGAAGSGVTGAAGTAGAAGTNIVGEGGSGGMQALPTLDSGRPALRRLTNLEYDYTVRDLLGVPGPARASFQPDEVTGGFDVIGDGQMWNDSRYEQYFNTAQSLAAAAFADPTLRKRIMTCETPDTTCLTSIVVSFGMLAWRRPLAGDEVTSLVGLATSALADGATLDDAVQRIVTALLSSAPFLMHVELDPSPSSTIPHQLTPYELLSRLSYLLWSSTPDAPLLALNWNSTDAGLDALVDSMLNDPRADGFVEGFAAEWLDFERLATHQIEPTLDPDFDQALRDAMGQELRLYVGAFRDQALDFQTFPGADFNFVNAQLAQDYGMAPPASGSALSRTVDLTDARAGFLGTGGFLLMTSPSGRSSPTARGAWILRHLLCLDVPAPPPSTPDSISSTRAQTGRALVDSIHAQPACAACHDPMDGMGVALEAFDELGRFRTTYKDGSPIDTKGTYMGQPIDGEASLAAAVGHDPRFLECASRKLMSFAVGRTLGDSDTPYANQILTEWKSGGLPTLRALIKAVVKNDTFKYRHGEAP
jgi:hypothetical protein